MVRRVSVRPGHKFRAKAVEHDGIRFPSKLEGRYYEYLKVLKQAGAVLFFLRQVPFHLPGGVVYRLDFMEFHTDGSVRCVDTKGVQTADFIAKKKMVEALYPVQIEVVKEVPKWR